ncbi:MAG: RNA polymerase sigma-70 factor [Bacteroidales bacterium]|nr:RNA polymerase sigma-70 factor [Bacteroidales bacterium]
MQKPLSALNINDNKSVIEALKTKDTEVFDAVYRFYYTKLCAFCFQYIKEQEEIEEIVQDTMMWLWENRSNLISDLSLKSLLFTIVKNKALNRLSHFKIKRKAHQEIYEKYQKDFNNPDFYLESELFNLYSKALKQLPEKYREAFEMNRKQHLTHNEIANKLNVSPQTINYRISQALKLLRDALKDYLPILILFLMNFFSKNKYL